jgi:predicted nucleotidyltransferase
MTDPLLLALRKVPGHRAHVREIARLNGVSPPTALRRLRRLEAAGEVRSEMVGRSRVYSLTSADSKSRLTEARALSRRIAEVEGENLVRVIAFGSVARGQADPRSDLDLLVVVRDLSNRPRAEARLARALPSTTYAVDLLVYTQQEVQHWSQSSNSVLHDAVTQGVQLGE